MGIHYPSGNGYNFLLYLSDDKISETTRLGGGKGRLKHMFNSIYSDISSNSEFIGSKEKGFSKDEILYNTAMINIRIGSIVEGIKNYVKSIDWGDGIKIEDLKIMYNEFNKMYLKWLVYFIELNNHFPGIHNSKGLKVPLDCLKRERDKLIKIVGEFFEQEISKFRQEIKYRVFELQLNNR